MNEKWALVSEYIKGPTLTQLLQQNPKKSAEYLAVLCQLQQKLSACRPSGLPQVLQTLQSSVKKVALPANIHCRVHALLAGSRPGVQLYHGDLTPDNIILTPNGAPYLVDWAHAGLGTPILEAANSYLWLVQHTAFGAEYLTAVCAQNGLDSQEITNWLPCLAAAKFSTANAEKRDFLRQIIHGGK